MPSTPRSLACRPPTPAPGDEVVDDGERAVGVAAFRYSCRRVTALTPAQAAGLALVSVQASHKRS